MNALDDILQEDAGVPPTEPAQETTGETGPPPEGDMSPVEETADRMVPIEALLDERRKRQELEQYLMEGHPETGPGPEAHMELECARMDASESAARGRHPDFDPKAQAFARLAAVDPSLIARLRNEPDPAEFAYRMGEMAMELAQGATRAVQAGGLPQSLSRTPSAGAAGDNAIIHVKENLTKKPGDRITIALVHDLSGAGVTGNTTLEGNEEALDTRSHAVTVNVTRHGVVVTELEEQKSAISLRDAARARLKGWALKQLRGDIITALGSIDGVDYGTATATQKNTWLTNNADRVLFGAATGNLVSGNHASSLLNVDSSADTLTPSMVSLSKRLAQAADPALRPITVNEEEEWFVLFAHPRAFRDLKYHADMVSAHRDAMERGQDNPLFTGGDLIWDGVIIREIPEMGVISGAGAGGIDIAPNYLCGAQALGLAWAQRTHTVTQENDYEFRHGVAVQEIRGVEKLRFGTGVNDTDTPKDHGVFTLFTAGVADA